MTTEHNPWIRQACLYTKIGAGNIRPNPLPPSKYFVVKRLPFRATKQREERAASKIFAGPNCNHTVFPAQPRAYTQ